MAVRHLITIPLAICSFVSVFYSIGKLMVFLSLPIQIPIHHVWLLNLLDDYSRMEMALLPLTNNAILTVVFILSHSFLRSDVIKRIYGKLGIEAGERCLYNIATAATLLLLVKRWEPITTVVLWSFDVEANDALYWIYAAVHLSAWIVIYGGSIIMDLPELTGVKQVYYDWNNFLPPSNYKSNELNHLHSHVRHPSFFGFSTVLWFTNVMSVDRFILAFLWTTYMYIAWRTDANDVVYQHEQLERKKSELLQ